MKDVKYKEGEWQSLSEGIVLLTSSGLFQWITEADRISDDAKSSCDAYDVDHAINIDTASNTNYEETEHRLTLLQQAIQHVPDTLSGSVDQPFYNAMDSLMEKLSNMNIMGYETMARGSFSNGVNSAGVAMPKMKVTLEDLLGNSSPLTDYLRVEYNQMKQQIGDVSFEDYKKMAFADTSFDYYSRNEKVKDLAVTLVINGAVLVIGGMLPWPLMVALGLTSGGKNISEAWRGKDLFTGKELSTGDRILRGLSGVADVALAGYGTYKGIKPVKGTKDVVVSGKGNGLNSGEETVTYRRVQGGQGTKSSQERIIVDNDGNIFINKKDKDLNISIDNGEHAKHFIENNRPGADLIEIEVPKWFDDFVQENMIPQAGSKTNPANQGGTAPKLTDPTTPGKSVEFPPPWSEWIEENAVKVTVTKGGKK